MARIFLAMFAFAGALASGCGHIGNCRPNACGVDGSAQPQETVVTAPPQKIVIEQAPAATVAAPAACNSGACAAPAACSAAAPAAFAAPSAVMPASYAAPAMGFPMAAGVPANATVSQRTGLGLEFTSIKIPIPFFKLIPVQKPAEVSFQIPPQSFASGFNPGFAQGAFINPMAAGMPMGMGMPMAAGMPMGMGMPMTAGMPMQAAYAPGMSVANVANVAAVNPASSTVNQAALLQALLAAQAGNGAPAAAATPAAASAETQDRVKCVEAQLAELEKLTQKLKACQTLPAPQK